VPIGDEVKPRIPDRDRGHTSILDLPIVIEPRSLP